MYPTLISITRIGGILHLLRVVEIRQKPHETHTCMGPLDKCGLSGGKIFSEQTSRQTQSRLNLSELNSIAINLKFKI